MKMVLMELGTGTVVLENVVFTPTSAESSLKAVVDGNFVDAWIQDGI